MNTVRKLNVVLMYLRRSGYSDAANALWLILVLAKGNKYKLVLIRNWLINKGSIEPLFKQNEFLYDGSEVITIKAGFRSLTKLLAVLPKEIR